MEYSRETLGEVVRERRAENDLTQDDLGKAAGYGAGAAVSVSRIEGGLTRPTAARFEGLARALGLSESELEALCIERERERAEGLAGPAPDRGSLGVRQRVGLIQREIEERTTTAARIADEFNRAHDKARDEFFRPFIAVGNQIEGAPKPLVTDIPEDDEDSSDAEIEVERRLRMTTYGVTTVLAGGVGGAAAGAAAGSAAAYGTFVAAMSFGTASTGTAISALSGAAASNAALAALGGGSLAAGGAGVAGGTALLTGMVAAPVLFFAIGGVLLMAKRNRQQQKELVAKLEAAEAELDETRERFEAVARVLPEASQILDYVGTHAGHALDRWKGQLGSLPTSWASLSPDDQDRFENFVKIAAGQLALVTLDFQQILTLDDDSQRSQIEFMDEMITQARTQIESLV